AGSSITSCRRSLSRPSHFLATVLRPRPPTVDRSRSSPTTSFCPTWSSKRRWSAAGVRDQTARGQPVEVVAVLAALFEPAALAGVLERALQVADAPRRRNAKALADRGAETGRQRRDLGVELAQRPDARLQLVDLQEQLLAAARPLRRDVGARKRQEIVQMI